MTAPQDRELARINDIERRLHALDGEIPTVVEKRATISTKPLLEGCQCYSAMHDACFLELFGWPKPKPAPAAETSEPDSSCWKCLESITPDQAARGRFSIWKHTISLHPSCHDEIQKLVHPEWGVWRTGPPAAEATACPNCKGLGDHVVAVEGSKIGDEYKTRNIYKCVPASSKGEKPMSDEEIGNRLIQRFKGLNPAWAQDYMARDVGRFARELLSRDLDVELIVERNQLAQENAKLREERDALKLDFERGCPGPDRIKHVAVTDALGLDRVPDSQALVHALKALREERDALRRGLDVGIRNERHHVELIGELKKLVESSQRNTIAARDERDALREELDAAKLVRDTARHDRDQALAKIDGAFAALRAK